jgi:hypothetical protein
VEEVAMATERPVKNAKGRLGRVKQTLNDSAMICYYNDGDRVYPSWEWVKESTLTPAAESEVRETYKDVYGN